MIKQGLYQKLLQKLSPQQIQLMKLIQLPTLAFEQKLKEELEENPALSEESESADNYGDLYNEKPLNQSESDTTNDLNVDEYLNDDQTPIYKLQSSNYNRDEQEKQIPYAAGTTFHQHLENQLNTYDFNKIEYSIAHFLIGSIDESGYLRRNFLDILDDLAFTQNIYTTEEEIKRLLTIIQRFEPAGVGARDLKECLLLQLKQKNETKARENAIRILENYFDSFVKKHYDKLGQRLGVDQDSLKESILEIEKLNPKPGGAIVSNNKIASHIVPDFIVKITDGEPELFLNSRNAPELYVSTSYQNMLENYKASKEKTKSQKDAILFIKQKLDSAKWFIDAVAQRQQTLLLNMRAIIEFQREYFITGDERKLKPMILKDIADEIEMDISTVSRVANSKYVETPYGTKLIKDFFSEAMKNDKGDDVSTIEIKSILEDLINRENKKKPLTDEKLSLLLKEKGYTIARRTVAKYRENLDIPVARLRKTL